MPNAVPASQNTASIPQVCSSSPFLGAHCALRALWARLAARPHVLVHVVWYLAPAPQFFLINLSAMKRAKDHVALSKKDFWYQSLSDGKPMSSQAHKILSDKQWITSPQRAQSGTLLPGRIFPDRNVFFSSFQIKAETKGTSSLQVFQNNPAKQQHLSAMLKCVLTLGFLPGSGTSREKRRRKRR